MDSILNTVKKMLGLEPDYDAFDTDIIVSINSALMTCMQLGVGPAEGFTVTGPNETWDEFIDDPDELIQLQAVKQYVYMHVRRAFDPPDSSHVATALDNSIKELEWRLNVQAKDG